MGGGARSEAIRLIGSAVAVLAELEGGDSAEPEHHNRIGRLTDHGISRRVDHQIRQRDTGDSAWSSVEVADIARIAEADQNLLVVLGSHKSGYIRQEAARLGIAIVESGSARPGITRMLAQRALDSIPDIRTVGADGVAALFAMELSSDNEGRLPTAVERGAREITEHTKSPELCPELVMNALDLFEQRVGRYSNNGSRDHHRHNLKEVDRREQILSELRRTHDQLEDERAITAGQRLIAFYEASMTPA